MERHTFSALMTLDRSASHDLVRRYLDGSRTCAILQAGSGRYFPAAIWCWPSQSSRHVVRATVSIPLLPGEADALLMSGQVFTVWADAVVSDVSVSGDGLLGEGVIVTTQHAGPTNAVDRHVRARNLPYARPHA